jgi:hypothetical protein
MAKDFVVNESGKFELSFTPSSGAEATKIEVFNFP